MQVKQQGQVLRLMLDAVLWLSVHGVTVVRHKAWRLCRFAWVKCAGWSVRDLPG